MFSSVNPEIPRTKGSFNLYLTVYGHKGLIYLASYAALSLGVGIGLTYLRSYNNGFRTEAFTYLKNGDLFSYQKTKNISIFMDILDPLIIRVMFSIQGYFKEWLFNHLFERLCDPKNFKVIKEFEEKSKKMVYSSDLLNGARSSMAIVHKTIFGGMGILQSYMTVSTIFAASTGIRVEVQVAVVFGLLILNFAMGYYNSKFANEANIKEAELSQRQEVLLKDSGVSPHQIFRRRDDLTALNSEIIACKDVQDYSKMINPELIGSVFWGASEAVLVNMLDPNNALLGMVYMSNLSVLNEMLRKLVRCGYEISDGFGIFRRLINNDLPIYAKITQAEIHNQRESIDPELARLIDLDRSVNGPRVLGVLESAPASSAVPNQPVLFLTNIKVSEKTPEEKKRFDEIQEQQAANLRNLMIGRSEVKTFIQKGRIDPDNPDPISIYDSKLGQYVPVERRDSAKVLAPPASDAISPARPSSAAAAAYAPRISAAASAAAAAYDPIAAAYEPRMASAASAASAAYEPRMASAVSAASAAYEPRMASAASAASAAYEPRMASAASAPSAYDLRMSSTESPAAYAQRMASAASAAAAYAQKLASAASAAVAQSASVAKEPAQVSRHEPSADLPTHRDVIGIRRRRGGDRSTDDSPEFDTPEFGRRGR